MSFRNGILAAAMLVGLTGVAGCAVPVNAQGYHHRDYRDDGWRRRSDWRDDWRRDEAWRRHQNVRRHQEWRRECYRDPRRC